MISQKRRHCVAYNPELRCSITAKYKIIRKGLDSGCFSNRKRSVLFSVGMDKSMAVFMQMSGNCMRWLVPF